jgi:hypothetical protein
MGYERAWHCEGIDQTELDDPSNVERRTAWERIAMRTGSVVGSGDEQMNADRE